MTDGSSAMTNGSSVMTDGSSVMTDGSSAMTGGSSAMTGGSSATVSAVASSFTFSTSFSSKLLHSSLIIGDVGSSTCSTDAALASVDVSPLFKSSVFGKLSLSELSGTTDFSAV